MTRATLLRLALVAALIAFCVAGFFACFEKREIEVETGISAEARRNKYLALGRLLERMGHEVVALDNPERLAALPAPPATLIFPTSRYSISERRSRALLDWVARGGHLVVVTYSFWSPRLDVDALDDGELELEQDHPDLILDRFALRQVAGKPTESEEEEEDAEESPAPAPRAPDLGEILSGKWSQPRTEASWAYFDEIEEPLWVGFSPLFRWEDPEELAVFSVEGPSGVHLVELAHGAGRISALTSDEPLTNGSIASFDNAEFIVRWLRRDAAARGPIWILYAEEWPGFLSLVRRHALPAAAGGAALLLLWIWRVVFRFGPALPAPSPARRRWLEHLEAAGRFHWRRDHGRALLLGMREQVLGLVRQRHPAWMRLAERERCERIAHVSGVALGEVEHALHGSFGGARSFVAATSALERIRAAL